MMVSARECCVTEFRYLYLLLRIFYNALFGNRVERSHATQSFLDMTSNQNDDFKNGDSNWLMD
jgi:hypothetical protein